MPVAISFTASAFTATDAHGTNVASTVAQVAPGAKVLLLDVFEGEWASDVDILEAINWAVANRAKHNICAINLSLGDSRKNPEPCAASPYEAPFAAARAAGIVPAVASGNNYWTTGLSGPACAPSAVSVGAVHDSDYGYFDACDRATVADKVACFANLAPYLDMLAPGSRITAGGVTMSGTSMAAPHVAAAAAVLKAAAPAASAEQVVAALKQGGKAVSDWYTGLTFPRLDVAAAATALLAGASAPDTVAPVVTALTLNGGAFKTARTAVTVAVAAKDDSPLSGLQMCVSAAPECDAFVPFAATSTFELPAGDGAKTVYVTLMDAAGNKGAAASKTITLDTAGPAGAVTINAGAQFTKVSSVTVKFSSADATAKAVCFTTSATADLSACGAWRTFKAWTTVRVTLEAGAGVKTVRAVFRNADGAVGPEAAATIVVDTVAPVDADAALTVAAASTAATLSWDAAAVTDGEGAGVAYFIATYTATGVPAAKCVKTRGTVAVAVPKGALVGTATARGLRASRAYAFRLCAVDTLGNVSDGVVATATTARVGRRSARAML